MIFLSRRGFSVEVSGFLNLQAGPRHGRSRPGHPATEGDEEQLVARRELGLQAGAVG